MKQINLAGLPALTRLIPALVALIATTVLPTLGHAARLTKLDGQVPEPRLLSVPELREEVQDLFEFFDIGSVKVSEVLKRF